MSAMKHDQSEQDEQEQYWRQWITPDWPAPSGVHSLITTRHGGVSLAPYASLNLATHVGDDPLAVLENRRRVAARLPRAPVWLNQVHGTTVCALAAESDPSHAVSSQTAPIGDAAYTRVPEVVCAVLTADCLPVLFCDRVGSVVAAAHAGWRGLHAGILAQTVKAMGCPPDTILAYFGPAIGAQAFVVGREVRSLFVNAHGEAAWAFKPLSDGRFCADIYHLARQALKRLGVLAVYGGGEQAVEVGSNMGTHTAINLDAQYLRYPSPPDFPHSPFSTAEDSSRFFSYRRDAVCGRMAALIYLS